MVSDDEDQYPGAYEDARNEYTEDIPDEEGQSKTLHDLQHSGLRRIHRTKTAYYNAASEKSLSHEEAKLFYQTHRLETLQQDTDTHSPLLRARTYSSTVDGDGGLSRTASTTSRRSGRGYVPRDRNWGLPMPLHDTSMHSPALHGPDPDDPESSRGTAHADGDEDEEYVVGPGSDMEDRAIPHSDISPELSAISVSIKKVLQARRKYLKLSLQGPRDNPKDHPDWKIYPPPPNPTWNANKTRPLSQTPAGSGPSDSKASEDELVGSESAQLPSDPMLPTSPSVKHRKPGQDIGKDFNIADFLPLPGNDESISYGLNPGSVYQLHEVSSKADNRSPLVHVPSLREFYMDMDDVQNISSDGPTKSFAYRQLDIIEGKFHLYHLVNSYQETADCKRVPHRDFYNVRKVDTHVHHSACMNQKHLLRFIKSKMKKSPDEIVMFRDNKQLTLRQVFESINLTAYDLSIDTLDMHAHTDSFHRFDKFNLKYNPIGESRLREIFLKTDNYIQGRYLAEITKEVISDLESSKYQFVEWRVSIYGRAIDEWDKLAAWVIDNKLVSHNVRWLIQIPRLYSLYRASGQMDSYEQIIINIFQPLYEVTKNPSAHEKLHVFLQRVVGFDSVDDESKVEVRLYKKYPPPRDWTTRQNPPYTYWIYHLFANMASLNQWRQWRGFNTFVLRPHCGEAGDVDHIAAAALCCHSISHGLMLRKVPLLQYIFYLDQIGIAMSPLSNNALFLAYERNPFLKYFKRGLNVSLSTDDPLQFAFTKEPLIEEYSVAAQIYRLSAVDMCELAHHSVIQSGYEHELKQRWLGPSYSLPGVDGNSVAKSNVPNIRERFRYKTLMEELDMLDRYAAASATSDSQPSPIPTSSFRGAEMHPVKILPLRSQAPTSNPTSNPNVEAKPFETERAKRSPGIINRSSSMLMSPSQKNLAYWADIAPSHPRIFPGVVHERSRKGSMRQGSKSEKDLEASSSSIGGAQPPLLSEQDESGVYEVLPEGDDEGRESE